MMWARRCHSDRSAWGLHYLQAQAGERTGITRRSKLAAVIVPVKGEGEYDLCGIFENLEGVRKRARRVKGVTVKDLVKEGRR